MSGKTILIVNGDKHILSDEGCDWQSQISRILRTYPDNAQVGFKGEIDRSEY